MKSKLVIGLLGVAFLFNQGFAFAEAAKDVKAVAEEVVVAENSANGTVDEAVVTDELVVPAEKSAKEIKAEAKADIEEVKETAAEEAVEVKAGEKEAVKEIKEEEKEALKEVKM